MRVLGDFAKGFLVMTVVIWILNIITFVVLGHIGMALLFLLILLIPLFIMAYEFSKYRVDKGEEVGGTDRLKRILISLYGVSFACWVFDVSTTYCAIDVLGVAAEQNPLGWPFGALGALIFYAPAFALTYLLMFEVKQRHSFLAAVFVIALALWIGIMNLIAGFQNFGFFTTYFVSLSREVYSYLFCAVIVVDSIYAMVFMKLRS